MDERMNTRGLREILIAADQNGDPAPDPVVLPTERARTIVRNISATTLDELARLRDQLDDLMRAVQAREEQVQIVFQQYADFSQSAVECKQIIADSIHRLRADFEAGAPHVGQTMTQRRD